MDSVEEVKRRLNEGHTAHVLAILQANEDLGERGIALGVTTIYDEQDDVLRTIIGLPTEAATESIDNTILLRYDPDTRKIVGIEVLGFQRLLAEEPSNRSPFVTRVRNLIQSLDAHRRATEQVSATLARELQELALAKASYFKR